MRAVDADWIRRPEVFGGTAHRLAVVRRRHLVDNDDDGCISSATTTFDTEPPFAFLKMDTVAGLFNIIEH